MQAHQLEELRTEADTRLPIFYMYPGTAVGSRVALHFFEPRYRIMIRRVWESNRLFLFCSSEPVSGACGVVVKVDQASFAPDGRARIIGQAGHCTA